MRVKSWCAMFLSAALCIQVLPVHGDFWAMPVQSEENRLRTPSELSEADEDLKGGAETLEAESAPSEENAEALETEPESSEEDAETLETEPVLSEGDAETSEAEPAPSEEDAETLEGEREEAEQTPSEGNEKKETETALENPEGKVLETEALMEQPVYYNMRALAAAAGELHGGLWASGSDKSADGTYIYLHQTGDNAYVRETFDSFEMQADVPAGGVGNSVVLSIGPLKTTALHKDLYNSSLFSSHKEKGIYYIEPNGSYYDDGNTWGQWIPDSKAYRASMTIPEGALIVFNFPKLSGAGGTLYDNAGREVIADSAYSNGNYKYPTKTQYIVAADNSLSGRWTWMKGPTYSHNNDADSDWEHAVTGGCYVYMDIQIKCEHIYGPWETIKQPGCTAKGMKKRCCTKCGENQQEEMAALDHDWEKVFFTGADNGTYYRRCKRGCGDITDIHNNPYTITYHPGEGGEGTVSSQNAVYSQQQTVKGDREFTRKYYSYKRWIYENDEGKTEYIDCGASTEGLTKKYKGIAALEPDWYQTSARVAFYDWDGTELFETETALGSKAEEPELKERPGYEFVSWDKDISCVKDHMEVKAEYRPRQYTYEFDSQGGTEVENKEYTYDTLLGSLPETERTGYTFAGWYDSPKEGALVTPKTEVKLGGEKLYARWIANSYYLKFRTRTASCGIEKKRVTYDEKVGILPQASMENFRFLGWFTRDYSDKTPEGLMNGDVPPGQEEQITPEMVYTREEDLECYGYMQLRYEVLENHISRRPGTDDLFGTKDDDYFLDGPDGTAGTRDDTAVYPGDDGVFGTPDDFYIDNEGREIHAGSDTIFGTEDDYLDNGDGTNTHCGPDGIFGTGDDTRWDNGPDKKPGTGDDRPYGEKPSGGSGNSSGGGGSGGSSGSGGGSGSHHTDDSGNGPGAQRPETEEKPGEPGMVVVPLEPGQQNPLKPVKPGRSQDTEGGSSRDEGRESVYGKVRRSFSVWPGVLNRDQGLSALVSSKKKQKEEKPEKESRIEVAEKATPSQPIETGVKNKEKGGFFRSIFELSIHPAAVGIFLLIFLVILIFVFFLIKYGNKKEQGQKWPWEEKWRKKG